MKYLKLRTALMASMNRLDECIRSSYDDVDLTNALMIFRQQQDKVLWKIADRCENEASVMLSEIDVGDANETT
jgi:hypothetical protein